MSIKIEVTEEEFLEIVNALLYKFEHFALDDMTLITKLVKQKENIENE